MITNKQVADLVTWFLNTKNILENATGEPYTMASDWAKLFHKHFPSSLMKNISLCDYCAKPEMEAVLESKLVTNLDDNNDNPICVNCRWESSKEAT